PAGIQGKPALSRKGNDLIVFFLHKQDLVTEIFYLPNNSRFALPAIPLFISGEWRCLGRLAKDHL
ncbi:MAG: hypothetical protein WA996_17540, partial [Candidatus Promineifilaceae bacterium]